MTGAPPGTGHPDPVGDARVRALWLTGQSSRRHSLLSPGQQLMLDALAEDGYEPLRVGFPWTAAAACGTYRAEPLALASVRNATQFASARWGRDFPRQIARCLQRVLDRTTDRAVILAGSAGAEMLASAAPSLSLPAGLAVRVVALGPVGRLPQGWPVHVVRGSRDLLSRWGCALPSDAVVPGGHLAAATSPQARDAVRRLLAEDAGAPGPTLRDTPGRPSAPPPPEPSR